MKLLDLLKNEFPDITWSKCRIIDRGWDHYVIVLDEKLIFRTPKRLATDPPDEFSNEIRLLHYLKDKIRIKIPYYKYVSKNRTMAGYEMLKGKELDQKLFNSLKTAEKTAVIEQYAEFITSLHSVPKNVIRKYHIRIENENKHFNVFAKRIRKNIYPKINAKYIDSIEGYFTILKSSIRQIKRRTLVHNDLTEEHILWDKQRQQINIIDFSDRCYGDPASDFAGIMEYGKTFVKRVYNLYGCQKDQSLLQRAELYYKRIPLSIMLDALDGFPCTFDEGYKMFRKRFDCHYFAN